MPVSVEFARSSGLVETLEGLVSYEVGEALLTGIDGERWPIKRARFETTYEPVAQLRMGDDGFYIKRAILIDAVQTEIEMEIAMEARNNTKLFAKPGDWIVTAPGGERWVVAGDIFLKTYTPAN